MPKLCQLAASAIGSESCVKVVEISEGRFNKVSLLTTNGGREVVAKLLNPNAGRPTLSRPLRNVLRLPISQIYGLNSRLLGNPVGAEYIIMEKQSGVMLIDVWDDMDGLQKAKILNWAVEIESALASVRFTKFGGLYYKHDLPQSDNATPLYIDGNGNAAHSAEFEIGSTN